MAEETESSERATLLAVLDCLLPGDGEFPTASATATPTDVIAYAGREGVETWLRPGLAMLGQAAGGEFLRLDRAGRTAVLERVERQDPGFFEWLLELTYYCYYMQPPVVDAIRRMGIEYNAAPQPRGYQVEVFDPGNPEMMPLSPRGSYKRTAEMTPPPPPAFERRSSR